MTPFLAGFAAGVALLLLDQWLYRRMVAARTVQQVEWLLGLERE
jgi:hypothetical protein